MVFVFLQRRYAWCIPGRFRYSNFRRLLRRGGDFRGYDRPEGKKDLQRIFSCRRPPALVCNRRLSYRLQHLGGTFCGNDRFGLCGRSGRGKHGMGELVYLLATGLDFSSLLHEERAVHHARIPRKKIQPHLPLHLCGYHSVHLYYSLYRRYPLRRRPGAPGPVRHARGLWYSAACCVHLYLHGLRRLAECSLD